MNKLFTAFIFYILPLYQPNIKSQELYTFILKTNIVINPEYEYLKEFIHNLPLTFETQGDIIQKRRNIIKSINVDGLKLNIKLFRKPIFINRIVYSFFRKPKAYKAYYNALEVTKRGFHTPKAIAYIELKKARLLSLSYFISTQIENAREIREHYFSKANEDKELLAAFAQYTAELHNAGILHLDYSPGNILISENNNQYQFSLVDINRMQFKNVDINKGCENFCRLFEYDEAIEFMAPIYAKIRNLDSDICHQLMLKYKHQFEKKKERKKRMKLFLGKK